MNTDVLSYSAQPEEKVQIPIPGTSLHINGVLRGDWSKPVVILMHGLPSSNRALLPFLGSKLLSEAGFSTLRLNMYDDAPGTRDMIDCLLQTHADDFDLVVEYVRSRGAPKIMAAGHSYGGLTILRSTAKLDAAVLWDPSSYKCSQEFDEKHRADDRPLRLEQEGIIVYRAGRGYLDPIAMTEERIKFADTPPEELAKKEYPMLFLAAGDGDLLPYIREYFAAANQPKELTVVKDASHGLDGTDPILFETFDKTTSFFKRYI